MKDPVIEWSEALYLVDLNRICHNLVIEKYPDCLMHYIYFYRTLGRHCFLFNDCTLITVDSFLYELSYANLPKNLRAEIIDLVKANTDYIVDKERDTSGLPYLCAPENLCKTCPYLNRSKKGVPSL